MSFLHSEFQAAYDWFCGAETTLAGCDGEGSPAEHGAWCCGHCLILPS